MTSDRVGRERMAMKERICSRWALKKIENISRLLL